MPKRLINFLFQSMSWRVREFVLTINEISMRQGKGDAVQRRGASGGQLGNSKTSYSLELAARCSQRHKPTTCGGFFKWKCTSCLSDHFATVGKVDVRNTTGNSSNVLNTSYCFSQFLYNYWKTLKTSITMVLRLTMRKSGPGKGNDTDEELRNSINNEKILNIDRRRRPFGQKTVKVTVTAS